MDINALIINKNAFILKKKPTPLNDINEYNTTNLDITKTLDMKGNRRINNKSSKIKRTNIKTNTNSKPKLYSNSIINLDINKYDKVFVKKLYYNILEKRLLYTLIIWYISLILIASYKYISVATIEVTRFINYNMQNIRNCYTKLGVDLSKINSKSKFSIYDLIKIIDLESLDYYLRYIKIKEIKDPIIEKYGFIQKPTFISKPYCYTAKSTKDKYNDAILDRHQIKYSKYSKNQDNKYNFNQTICQPLNIINSNGEKQTRLYNNEKLSELGKGNPNNIICTDGNKPPIETEYSIVENNLDNPDIKYIPNIYLPKFLGMNTLSYDKSLENFLRNGDKYNDKSYHKLITKKGVWNSPPDISGELDIDKQIKATESLLIKICGRISRNFKHLITLDSKINKLNELQVLKIFQDDYRNIGIMPNILKLFQTIGIVDYDNKLVNLSGDNKMNQPYVFSFKNGYIINTTDEKMIEMSIKELGRN